MANKNSFKKGSIEMLILALLKVQDCYGYQITQLVKEQSDELITITEGSLYPTLYKLQDKKYISDYKKVVGKRLTRIYYHLEPEGATYLDELLADYRAVQQGIQKILDSNNIN